MGMSAPGPGSRMRIALVTPAPPRSRAGNRATAVRWARILRGLGHRVDVREDYVGDAADLMVALHAWRSAEAVLRYRETDPRRPLVVALTGTDLYRFIHSHPEATLRSVALADRLVALHDLAGEAIPAESRPKLRVIHQSAPPLAGPRRPVRSAVRVCVAGHLREEKDPLRGAYAVRDLPRGSRLQVVHYGRAHAEDWARLAQAEQAANPRYRWYGEVPHWQVRRAYASSHLMLVSSRMEGGANVVSEALAAGLPVVGSAIAGNLGLLGEDYPGCYPVGSTQGLRDLLLRAESDPGFYADLESRCAARRHLFSPQREASAWKALLAEL